MTRIKGDDIDTTDLEDVVRGVRAIDAQLDEVARARIAAGVGRHLDAREIARARRGAGFGRSSALAALRWIMPSLAAAATVWVAVARLPTATNRGPSPSTPASSLASFDRIEVPAGTRARARLGRADLTVVGPAQLEVIRAVASGAASDVTMRLSSGTLVGDYDGHAGGHLRIETPRLVADIVGTRFMIEATPAHARVSVAHGRVAVRDAATPEGAAPTFVGGGESWEVGTQRPAPIPAPVMDLLSPNAASPEPVADARDRGAPAMRTDGPSRASASPPPDRAAKASAPHASGEVVASKDDAPRVGASKEEAPRAVPSSSNGNRAEQPQPAPALAPPAVAAPPAPFAAAPSPAELYRRAEDAMARRDSAAARRSLEEIVTRYPRDVAADSARFELAREALAAGATARARRWVGQLIAEGHDRSLVESARFLECRIAREGGEPEEARACLDAFRAQHPRSVRDQEALATLVRLADERGACDEARVLRAEHHRLYPDIDPPEADRARCPR